ncbi:MAG: UDP-2,3-diacylglucosamine diphosphatase [Chitinophagales bacterium]|nr:UDP-2,3-diacylglucosamine diphosphatase [Chitinophagales bacterium]
MEPIPKVSGKIYFVSDIHLGVPDYESSLAREKRFCKWLDEISKDAHAIFILGDLFDFWFEYREGVARGFVRVLGKLAELRDRNIPIYFFTGNHDQWMKDYFTVELGIPVFQQQEEIKIAVKRLLLAHGDGLVPCDHGYK